MMEPRYMTAKEVEGLFGKLEKFYGNEWRMKWKGCNMHDVHSEWAEQLGSLHNWQIDFALANLPERAPNLIAFKKLALSATGKSDLQEGNEWAWKPIPMKTAPRIGQKTVERVQQPKGGQYRPLHGDAPTEQPLTLSQRARSMAYMAQTWAALGYTENADKAQAQCAEFVELARDAGESTPTAAALQDEAERDFAAARARQRAEELHGLTEPQRPQFDLAALLARRGTKDEHPRDWARIIAAKVERGGQVSDYAVKKAREALKDYEGERWLQSRAKPQTVLATLAPMQAAENAPGAQFDGAEDLPW